ncbi:MAG TPA: tRNA-specific adenosine deaminase [Bacteroidales bacterium]|nr:tRNA-specific adenosine deaminase [Bacteroidales bacterium]
MTVEFPDEIFMKAALDEAQKARDKGEVPVGAVVVCNDSIIARAHNLTETLNDCTAHAEMQAITAASTYLGGKYLDKCSLYVTLEPCTMCAGALFWSRVDKLVYGADDEKRGYTLNKNRILHRKTKVVKNVMEKECHLIIKDFFKMKRKDLSD